MCTKSKETGPTQPLIKLNFAQSSKSSDQYAICLLPAMRI